MTITTEVLVPALPESVADATVLAWHKKPGDPVRKDESLVDLETDKVVLEVPAPADGQLSEILMAVGEVVTASTVLGRIGAVSVAPVAGAEPAKPTASASVPVGAVSEAGAILAPAARRLVKELDLNPAEIAGSGKDGRIHKSDVVAHLDQREASRPAADVDTTPRVTQAPALSGEAGRPEQRVPMTRLRARVAERLVQAQQTAAILTTFNEVDMQPIMELRNNTRISLRRHMVCAWALCPSSSRARWRRCGASPS
jgi:2-oxoglutarate dehydrogenase E2 component (dihydrolipoamide succinyltransferase)